MAQEIKNTFLKSKMNKDLDDRILPNGEYRDALNISVGRSESDDVGALENIIGNNLITSTSLFPSDVETIGVYASDANESIFIFLTNYKDPNPNEPTPSPDNKSHYIYSYNSVSEQYTKLVEGAFLNFSKTNRVISINLLEELLFWTDNRNQPRKINVNLAAVSDGVVSASSSASKSAPAPALPATSSIYYTKEHQISVAKYNPYQSIQLFNKIEIQNTSNSASIITVAGNQTAALLPFIGGTVITDTISGNEFITITGVTTNGGQTITTCTISPSAAAPIAPGPVVFVNSTMTNKSSDDDWPGDPNYLEDIYARFSYRFKYDDNEYSLMAPFTQIAYIPTQKGYFVEGDEESAYQSTVVDFMKNNVQNIGLVIPLPDEARNIGTNYKIKELDVLFREAGTTNVKVLESIPISVISETGATNLYTYDYQSRKPYRVLPEAQTVRVYDKVPIRAFAQETAGNRIIYGNYHDKHTPPLNLDYNCRISPKFDFGKFTNFIEYPNSSVKRNRNYQVGFVLVDKFGRSSPVLLSAVDKGIESAAGLFFAGSTIYSPYDNDSTDTDIKTWFGDAISLTINSSISSFKNSTTGTPGLYATPVSGTTSGIGYAIVEEGSISGNSYIFTLDPALPNNRNIPSVGNSLRGEYVDYVTVTAIVQTPSTLKYTVTTNGQVNQSYLWVAPPVTNPVTPVLRFAFSINDLGWYSYKVVVKQTEQDYYNAYLPGFLNGYPVSKDTTSTTYPVVDPIVEFPANELNKTAHVVLLNDNINKIPRDLSEVGPEQKQYRSSVKLFGRVNNFQISAGNVNTANRQYFPRSGNSANARNNVVSTIATAKELEFAPDFVFNPAGLYQLNTNPYIARLSTSESGSENPIGVIMSKPNGGNTGELGVLSPILTIYETEPQESLLDIYWESTSEGLISDLNSDIETSEGGGAQIQEVSVSFFEDKEAGDSITGNFYALNAEGQILTETIFRNLSVTNANGNVVTRDFELINNSQTSSEAGSAFIRLTNAYTFTNISAARDIFTFNFDAEIILLGIPQGNAFQSITGPLLNIAPNFQSTIPIDPVVQKEEQTTDLVIEGQITASNGSSVNQISQIVYSMTVNPPVEGWSIDTVVSNDGLQVSAVITRAPYAAPIGSYEVTVTATDAAGGTGALSAETIFKVLINPASVNEDLIDDLQVETCGVDITNPTATPAFTNPVFYEPRMMVVSNQGSNQSQGFSPLGRYAKNAIWYISKKDLDPDPLYINDPQHFHGENMPEAFLYSQLGGGVNPANGWSTFIYKINGSTSNHLGNSTHTQGSLTLSFNMSMNTKDATGNIYNFDHSMGIEYVKWYYRFDGDSNQDWQLIPSNADANQSPSGMEYPENGDPRAETRLPWYDQDPNLPPGNFDYNFENRAELYRTNADKGIMYSSGTRTLNRKDFGNLDRDIEYCVVASQITSVRCSKEEGPLFGDTAVGWLIASDLYNAKCVPSFGNNVAEIGNPSRVILRSTASDGQTLADDVIQNEYDQLYTNVYYGEFINTLYTNVDLTEIYKPVDNINNFINYKYLIPLFPEPRKINGREFEYGQLQWAANFDSITGAKLYTANTVGSIQTSDKPASELNGLRNPIYNKTTIRNYNIFQII